MMRKYFKFGVDNFNTLWVMGYIKVLHDDSNNDLVITIARLFLQNRQAKTERQVFFYIW